MIRHLWKALWTKRTLLLSPGDAILRCLMVVTFLWQIFYLLPKEFKIDIPYTWFIGWALALLELWFVFHTGSSEAKKDLEDREDK